MRTTLHFTQILAMPPSTTLKFRTSPHCPLTAFSSCKLPTLEFFLLNSLWVSTTVLTWLLLPPLRKSQLSAHSNLTNWPSISMPVITTEETILATWFWLMLLVIFWISLEWTSQLEHYRKPPDRGTSPTI